LDRELRLMKWMSIRLEALRIALEIALEPQVNVAAADPAASRRGMFPPPH